MLELSEMPEKSGMPEKHTPYTTASVPPQIHLSYRTTKISRGKNIVPLLCKKKPTSLIVPPQIHPIFSIVGA